MRVLDFLVEGGERLVDLGGALPIVERVRRVRLAELLGDGAHDETHALGIEPHVRIGGALLVLLLVVVLDLLPRLLRRLARLVGLLVAEGVVLDVQRRDAVADLDDARLRRSVLHQLLHPRVEAEADHHADLGLRGALDVLRRRVEGVLVVSGRQQQRDVRVGTGDAPHDVVDGKDRDAHAHALAFASAALSAAFRAAGEHGEEQRERERGGRGGRGGREMTGA